MWQKVALQLASKYALPWLQRNWKGILLVILVCVSVLILFLLEAATVTRALYFSDELEKSEDSKGWFWPIEVTDITSPYGERIHPISGKRKMHDGVDIGAPTGTAVFAAVDGTVIKASPGGGYGEMIILRHHDGYETRYAHLSGYVVEYGTEVKQGQLIGLVGNTGDSTGSHLHFEVRHEGETMDPVGFLMSQYFFMQGGVKKLHESVSPIEPPTEEGEPPPVPFLLLTAKVNEEEVESLTLSTFVEPFIVQETDEFIEFKTTGYDTRYYLENEDYIEKDEGEPWSKGDEPEVKYKYIDIYGFKNKGQIQIRYDELFEEE